MKKHNKVSNVGYYLVSEDEKFTTNIIDTTLPKDHILNVYLFDYINSLMYPTKPAPGAVVRTLLQIQEELEKLEDHITRGLCKTHIINAEGNWTAEAPLQTTKFKIVKVVTNSHIYTPSKQYIKRVVKQSTQNRINKIIAKLDINTVNDEALKKFEKVVAELKPTS